MILDGISRYGAEFFVMLSLSVAEISVGKASDILSVLCTESSVVLNKNGVTTDQGLFFR